MFDLQLEFLSHMLDAVIGLILLTLCALCELFLSLLFLAFNAAILATLIFMAAASLVITLLCCDALLSAVTLGGAALALMGILIYTVSTGVFLYVLMDTLLEHSDDLIQLPLSVLTSALISLVLAPFHGLQHGWDLGFLGVLYAVEQYFEQDNVLVAPVWDLRVLRVLFENRPHAFVIPGPQPVVHAPAVVIPQAEPLAAHEAVFAPWTLTQLEWTMLQSERRGLTAAEKRQCQDHQDKGINALYNEYTDREKFIDPRLGCEILFDEVPLTAERMPSETAVDSHKAMLLVKQYQTPAGQWLAVPHQSWRYAESSLIGIINSGRPHPSTRDDLRNPAQHENMPTRYRIHPMFDQTDAPMISQELNLIADKIRQRLAPAPSVAAAVDLSFADFTPAWCSGLFR